MPVNFHLLIFPVWLPVEHAACQHGVAWPGSPLRAQDGPQGLRAVESVSTEPRDKQSVVHALTGPPVAHYLRGDASPPRCSLSRQRTASCKFLIRKVLLARRFGGRKGNKRGCLLNYHVGKGSSAPALASANETKDKYTNTDIFTRHSLGGTLDLYSPCFLTF